jgi:hypothetical protein
MLSLTADMTMNAGDSRRTMERIWDLRKKPGRSWCPATTCRCDSTMTSRSTSPSAPPASTWSGALERTTLIELKV